MMKILAIAIVLFLSSQTCAQDVTHIVRRVVDGDTFEIETGTRVTLRGVIANGGKQSKAYLELLILDRPVILSNQRPNVWGETEAVVKWSHYDVGEAMIRWGQASRRDTGTVRYGRSSGRQTTYGYRVQNCVGRT